MLSFLAYADRCGVITITAEASAKPAPPKGTFPIAMHADRAVLQGAVAATAHRAPDDDHRLLVPGGSAGKGISRNAVHELIRQVENRLLFATGRAIAGPTRRDAVD